MCDSRVGSGSGRVNSIASLTPGLAQPGSQSHTHSVSRLLAQQPEGSDHITRGIDWWESG